MAPPDISSAENVDGPTGARADVCLGGPPRAAVPPCTEMVRGAADRLERVAMRLDTLDWNDLRYFLAAARAGTLAGAARLLGVKHPTVGRRLDALERAIGAALVIRTETGIRLTPLGETLVGHAEQVERSVEELKAALPPRPQRFALPYRPGSRRSSPRICRSCWPSCAANIRALPSIS